MWYDVFKRPSPNALNQKLLQKNLPRILVCLNIPYLHCFEGVYNRVWLPDGSLIFSSLNYFRQKFKADFSWDFRPIIFPRSLSHNKLWIKNTRSTCVKINKDRVLWKSRIQTTSQKQLNGRRRKRDKKRQPSEEY